MKLSYLIDKSLAGRELRLLALGPWGFSEKLWKRIKWNGRILVNGREHHDARLRVKTGDRVELIWQEKTNVIPVQLPLDILYEDDMLLVVNKPANMLIHPTYGSSRDTLVHAVAGYLARKGEQAGVHPLYRLDRDTTGVVVIAKSAKVQYEMTRRHDQLSREYLAIIEGHLANKKGRLTEPIGPDPAHKNCWMVRRDGRSAVTEYEVVKEGPNCSLLKIHLLTGRTHQIRVHFSSIGHPLIGDRLYGRTCQLLARQALHAQCISFAHPHDGRKIICQAPVPDDMQQFMQSCFT
ncbi:MAG: RluA family pseudouridine synthase [Mitsuokella sp.]|uniref:RluA family pseudouridine synthase n=1 Tax=Mitsuokella sp. TaxID=2049034 RepID=UPI003F010078